MLEIILENPLSLLELTFAELLLFALLELDGLCVLEELAGVVELEEIAWLEDDSTAEQFSPMQNVSVSAGFPMSVIFRPVLEPLYQRMAGYLSSENSE